MTMPEKTATLTAHPLERLVSVRDVARDKDGVAHIVPVSGEKDSTCLALALKEREPRPYTYVYTPTGDELPDCVHPDLGLQIFTAARDTA